MNSKTMVEELVTWCLSGWKKPFYFSLFYRFNLSFANKQSCSLRSMESHVRTTIPLVPFNFLLTNELKFKLEVCMRHVQLNAICVWVWPKQNAIKSGSYHRFITFSSRVSIQSWAQKCYQFLEARVFHGLHHVMMNAGSWELWELRAESNKHQPTFMFKLKLFDQYRLYFIRYHFNMFHVSCVALVSRETAAIHRKQYPFNLRVGGHLNN